MKLVLSYLERHIALIVALLAGTGIFIAVLALCSVPALPALYAGALTLAVFAAIGVVRFVAFRRRHKALLELASGVENGLGGMPNPSSIVEEDYQRILGALDSSKRELETRLALRESDMEEYYTLWAHQIKTPIAAMRLLLSDSAEHAKLRGELFLIEQYVDMALNFVRAESDSSDIVLSRVELDCVIRASIRRFAGMFVTRRLSLDFSPTELTVLTDEKWLSFSIDQLISNALKYTKNGGITIYALDKTLVIADTGIGIAAEDLPRVFEKGYTGYNGRADRKSTGIGLYLVKKMLTKLGHSIALESAVGRGTAVSIDLAEYETKPE